VTWRFRPVAVIDGDELDAPKLSFNLEATDVRSLLVRALASAVVGDPRSYAVAASKRIGGHEELSLVAGSRGSDSRNSRGPEKRLSHIIQRLDGRKDARRLLPSQDYRARSRRNRVGW
jgi:hypothetical protein